MKKSYRLTGIDTSKFYEGEAAKMFESQDISIAIQEVDNALIMSIPSAIANDVISQMWPDIKEKFASMGKEIVAIPDIFTVSKATFTEITDNFVNVAMSPDTFAAESWGGLRITAVSPDGEVWINLETPVPFSIDCLLSTRIDFPDGKSDFLAGHVDFMYRDIEIISSTGRVAFIKVSVDEEIEWNA